MSNYDGKIEPLPRYSNQGNEHYLSSDKPDTYLWLAEENTKQAKKIELLQKKLDIATKALEEYATNESYKLCVVYCHYGEPVHASDVAIQALKEIDLVGTSTKGE